ncbi:hypothetical protein, partial [Zavarzinia sp.]|uniref:hypothetical protein n=1 Tax=Zavarzinia sp. TaxID=2027920 RepID=UPI003BB6C5DE
MIAMRPVLLLLLLSAGLPARAQSEGWQVACTTTSAILDGKVVPGGACAASARPAEGAAIKFWTEVRSADGLALRGPSVTFDMAVPKDRLAALTARFAGNAAVLAAGASYQLSLASGARIEGRCTRLVIPPQRTATPSEGPKPLAFDRMGCQIDDADGSLRQRLTTDRSAAIAMTIGGVRLAASMALPEGGDEAFRAALARLAGEAPSAPAVTAPDTA